MIVYPDKINKKIKGRKKICHPGFIKKMIMNLQKLEYTENSSKETKQEFFEQYELIYQIFWTDYYAVNERWINENIFFILQLLSYLGFNDCILDRGTAQLTFEKYDYYLQFSYHILDQKINECQGKKVIVPFIMNFNGEAHANLLIADTVTKKIYRVEPNYGFPFKKHETAIENRLEHLAKMYNYTYGGYLPSSCKKTDHPGLCIFIAVLLYTHGIRLTNDQIKETIIGFFKSEYNRLCGKNLKI
jgi:hypothetical protein